MSFKLYKEGQGTWARGALAAIVGAAGLFAATALFELLGAVEWATQKKATIPLFNWGISWQVIFAAAVLLPFGVAGILLFNHAKLSDFLIETESELKNKVTWPTRKEATNNSIVVVITCVLMGIWVTMADQMLRVIKNWIYQIQ